MRCFRSYGAAVALIAALLTTALACSPAAPAQQPTAQKPAEPAKAVEKPAAPAAQKPAAPAEQKPAAPAAQKPAAPAAEKPAQKPSAAQGATLGPGPKVSITLVGVPSPTLVNYTKIEAPYAKEIIPQRSNGRVEVKISTWAELNLQGNEIIRLVRQGQADIGWVSFQVGASDVPLLDVADLPGLNPTTAQARKVTTALLPVFNRELERFGVKVNSTLLFPMQVFFCRQPIKGLDDLKGKKIRSIGTSQPDLVAAVGAQAVNVGLAEAYSALERGVVDCGITGTASGNAQKWQEVTTHLYTLPVNWAIGGYYVNLAWWNKLDPDVRQFIDAIFKEMEEKQYALADELNQDGIDCNTGRPTCKLGTPGKMVEVKPSADDLAREQKLLAEVVLPNWVKRCGERCGDIYNQVVAPLSGVTYTKR